MNSRYSCVDVKSTLRCSQAADPPHGGGFMRRRMEVTSAERAVSYADRALAACRRRLPCARRHSPYSPRAFKDLRTVRRKDRHRMTKANINKVVLAYSGGLDTSIILKWLQTTYGCEVVTFTADLGQGDELEPARHKAELLGVKPENIFIEDVREEFVRDYVFPMFRANALYEGQYLLGTSIARPLIAKHLIDVARKVGADAIAHGATGKGN